MTNVIQIGQHQYIHVLDENTIITRLECGPQTFVKKAHEKIVRGCTPMIEVHPRHFCRIQNPVVIGEDGDPEMTLFNQVKVKHGETEIRFHRNKPFPLFPGEKLLGQVQKMKIIEKDQALLVEALRDFEDSRHYKDKVISRKAGEKWYVKGPKTYYENVMVKVLSTVKSKIIKPNCALKLTAQHKLIDINKKVRHAGEQWLIRREGSYLPRLHEQIVEIVHGVVITHKEALKVRATKSFKDNYGIGREAGEEWLVTNDMAQIHIIDVYEESVKKIYATTLSNRQYCVVLDPFDLKKKSNQYGEKEQRRGERTFFLQPGEQLQNGVQDVRVLGEEEALLLKARESFKDGKQTYKAGQTWMIKGPTEYFPPIEVQIVETRRSIPLDKNEGIYVRNLDTGVVTAVIGQTYMLKENEVLWEKELSPEIERLIANQQSGTQDSIDMNFQQSKQKRQQVRVKRNKTRVVTYKVPQNAAVQLYDYKTGNQKVVFGPGMILLKPNEEFTLIKLSGGTPKREGKISTVAMQLGPDFMTDIVEVETSDHAKLQLQLCYNWHFDIDKKDVGDQKKLFQVQDFVGNCCKNIASRVRGKVSSVAFEDFQKESETVIKTAVFGTDQSGQIREYVHFKANNLIITSVDVKSSQPVDAEVRQNLAKSINVSMNMTTQQNEAKARHKAAIKQQKNQGKLKCQQLEDLYNAEKSKQDLLKEEAKTLLIKLQGEAKARANAKSEESLIIGKAQVKKAELQVKAENIKAKQELQQMIDSQQAQLKTIELTNNLVINKSRKMAEIEIKKFQKIIGAIGKETLVAISKSGPEMKAKMLKGLGLKGFLVTDGKNPINLFNTANGMLGSMPQQQ